jgi:NhaP-type Na+/H+ or K+/H+ antiporter
MACSLVFKLSRFLALNSIAEVSVMYMFGILSYVIAELVHMSGVITVLVCGVALAHLNFYNLSITGQISTGYL